MTARDLLEEALARACQVAWQDEALATAQRCGMRALTSQLLGVSGDHEPAHGGRL